MNERHIHMLMQYLQLHPHWGIFAAFLFSFLESLAIIGSIIPGSITMTAIGALVGAGVLPAIPVFLWSICGAYTGDVLSFWFGYHYHEEIRKMWPFNKYTKWLVKGEAFFARHGGKSIIIGRFFGPMRPMTPMIAGIVRMQPVRFLLAATVAACGWAILYLAPGVALGALSLELPAGKATEFILISLLIVATLWFISWLIRHFFKHVWNRFNQMMMSLWHYLKQHKKLHFIPNILANRQHPDDHHQLSIFLFTVITATLFLLVMISIINHGFITAINMPIHELFLSLRNRPTDNIMIVFTILGRHNLLYIVAAVILTWILWHRQWWAATHWIAILLLSTGSIILLKNIIHSPRPVGLLHQATSYSFPSGHITLSISLFGFLAVMIAHRLKPHRRTVPYYIVAIFVGLIAFSRLYLGAHWVSDIIGSILLGTTWVLLVTLSYRRSIRLEIPLKTFTAVIVLTVIFTMIGYGIPQFPEQRQTYTPYWPKHLITVSDWWQQPAGSVPLYRTNRLGKAHQAFNVQWLGSLNQIEKALLKKGWIKHPPKLDLNGTLYRLASSSTPHRLPLLPMLYQNRSPELIMTREISTYHPVLILRLWQTTIKMKDSDQTLWLGSINYHLPPHRMLTLHHTHAQHWVYKPATSQLIPYLKGYKWHMIIIHASQQPDAMHTLHWNGKVLLIKSIQ